MTGTRLRRAEDSGRRLAPADGHKRCYPIVQPGKHECEVRVPRSFPTVPPNPRPGARAWSLEKFGRRIDCVLQEQDAAGCDCRVFDEDGWCLYRRRWVDDDQARADADRQRRSLTDDGWTVSA